MVVTGFKTGGGAGEGELEDEPEPEDELEPDDELEPEDELEDEPDDEGVVGRGVATATVVENVETVSSPRLTTKTLEAELRSAYAGMMPTFDCEIAVSPETSMVVLAPAWLAPFWVRTRATLLKFGFGRVGMTGVATGR
jgi:hypothetical protein